MKKMLVQSFALSNAPHAEVLAPALEAYMDVLVSKTSRLIYGRSYPRRDLRTGSATGEGIHAFEIMTDFVQHFWAQAGKYDPVKS